MNYFTVMKAEYAEGAASTRLPLSRSARSFLLSLPPSKYNKTSPFISVLIKITRFLNLEVKFYKTAGGMKTHFRNKLNSVTTIKQTEAKHEHASDDSCAGNVERLFNWRTRIA